MKKNIKLDRLKVESFVTASDQSGDKRLEAIKGGLAMPFWTDPYDTICCD